MSDRRELRLADDAAMQAFGAALATAGSGVLYLRGELGTGKTTLARGFLRARGHAGAVRSPTYTLLEPYALDGGAVYHLDLYRLTDAEELEYLGLRDLLEPGVSLLIEWPERGGARLPPADLLLELEYAGSARRARLASGSAAGRAWLARLASVETPQEPAG